MKPPAPPHITPETLAAMLEIAASMAPEKGITPHSLLDSEMVFKDRRVRGHLMTVITHRLIKHHKCPVWFVSRAYRQNPGTTFSRGQTGKNLIRRQPWKRIYQALP